MLKAEDESERNGYISAGAEQEAALASYRTRKKMGFRIRPNDEKA